MSVLQLISRVFRAARVTGRGAAGTARRRQRSELAAAMQDVQLLEPRFVLAAPNPMDLLNALNIFGLRFDGQAAQDATGFSVSGCGDLNGDGYDDFATSARNADPGGDTNAGETYVVFGWFSGGPYPASALNINGANGFRIPGIDTDDFSGWSVSGAGDINGDGLGDLIIGAHFADPAGVDRAGEVYVVFGKGDVFPVELNPATMTAAQGFRIDGADADDQAGLSVSGAGDFNADGYNDLIIGVPGGDPGGLPDAGESYLLFGKTGTFGTSLLLSTIDGTNGIRLEGVTSGDRSGHRVSAAGDVNGDGYDDVLVGSVDADPGSRLQAGSAWLVFGGPGPFSTSLALASLDGTTGVRFDGIDAGDAFGAAVGGVGDFNGDGFDDIAIGAPGRDPGGVIDAGEAVVVLGGSAAFPALFDVTLLSGSDGFRLSGTVTGDQIAGQLSSAGDMNGDGFDDVLIGAPNADPESRSNAGEAYIVFGRAAATTATMDLSVLDGTFGFRILGARADDNTAVSVASGGDLNADGFDDILLGADGVDANFTGTGAATVIFSRNFTGGAETQWAGEFGLTTVTATQGAGRDVLIGDHYNETLIADGGSDVLRGGGGIDRLTIPDADFSGTRRLNGGSGDDTLRVTGTNVSLDLTAIRDNRIEGIETIDLTGGGVNQLTLNPHEVINLSSTSNSLLVRCDSADVVNRGSGWIQLPDETIFGDAYEAFQAGAAFLRVLKPDVPKVGCINVASLNGTNGFRLDGVDQFDNSGYSVSGAGDVNADGLADLIIGAPRAEAVAMDRKEGHTYVVFGRTTGFGTTFLLSTLDGTNGFRIDGPDDSDMTGTAVSRAGDVNGDGIDDLIIGAPDAEPTGSVGLGHGQAWVVLGRRTAFASVLPLSSLNGTTGFVINGKDGNDKTGFSVSAAGDLNGDGFDDVIVGAKDAETTGSTNDEGHTFVVFGRAAFPVSINVASLSGTDGFRIDGITDYRDMSGWSVSSAGDFNGDSFADLLIGAPFAEPAIGTSTGESYVVFGKATGFASTIALATLNGTNGFRIEANSRIRTMGISVAAAGDFNGDGFDDLILGASSTDPSLGPVGGGAVLIVFGRSSATPAVMKIAELDDSQALRISGVHYLGRAGSSVSGGGDVNGDGFDDIVVGADEVATAVGLSVGEAAVVFGRANPQSSQMSLARLDGTSGFTIQGAAVGHQIGATVSIAGDVNGDGFDDIIVGADDASPDGKLGAGSSFVVFGWKTSTGSETQVGNNSSNALTASRGAAQPDVLIGGGGNDTLTGDGGLDVLLGDAGDDRLAVRSLDFRRIEGGTGFDTLQLNAAGLHLNLPALPNNRLAGIEEIDLRGTGANSLTANPVEVRNVTGSASAGTSANTLRVRRQSDDIVNMGTGWVQQANVVQNGLTWQVFRAGTAVLQIEILTFNAPGANTAAVRPAFAWASVPGVVNYELWINNDSANVAPFLTANVTGTSYTPIVDFPIGKYRAWARPVGGVWPPAYTFQVTTSVTPQAMERVQLTSRPTVRWNPLPGAVNYDFWLDNASTQQSQVVRTTITGTSWTPSAELSMGVWRAWVRGIDAKGNFAGWSPLIEFQVLPGATPVSPLNPTFDRRPVFQWNTVTGAASYEVFVRNRNTGVLVSNGTPTAATTWTPASDLEIGPYRWWVVAVSTVATGSLKSGGANTVDIFVGGRTTLLSPIGSTSDTTPDFFWRAVDGAGSYRLFVQTLESTLVTVVNQTVTSTSFTPASPLVAGAYRAWVQAIRANGDLAPWSLAVDFTIV